MLDALADNSYEVVGFQRDHKKADFSDPQSYNWGSVIKNFKPVATGFREQAIKEREDALSELSQSNDNKDSAVHIIASTLASVAALSTMILSF